MDDTFMRCFYLLMVHPSFILSLSAAATQVRDPTKDGYLLELDENKGYRFGELFGREFDCSLTK